MAVATLEAGISYWALGASYKAVGVKSGILTAKHGCGFLLWPTNVTLPGADTLPAYARTWNRFGDTINANTELGDWGKFQPWR